METGTVPEVNKRKPDGLLRHVAETMIGKQSRKVAFGIWLFMVATTLLKTALISSDQWLKCTYLSGGLIGFGTILDDLVRQLGSKLVGIVADRVGSVISTKVEKTETVVTQP